MTKKTQTILITGASSGIGREFARLLAAEKHSLVLVARNLLKLEELQLELRGAHGIEIHLLSADLSQPGAAQQVFDFTQNVGLEVDVLINNAGVGMYGEHLDLGLEEVNAMLRLNIEALTDLAHLYGTEMRRRRSGRILNVASAAAYQPTPFFAAYGASKSFVLNFSEALAMELADYGVSVSCFSPGPTDTGFYSGYDQQAQQTAHLAKSERVDVRRVAQLGLATMWAGELSRVAGTLNTLRTFSLRFASRAMVARISKGLMRASSPKALGPRAPQMP
jgi:short-subunit dehydrogenase